MSTAEQNRLIDDYERRLDEQQDAGNIDYAMKQRLLEVHDTVRRAAVQASSTIDSCAQGVITTQAQVQALQETVMSFPAVATVGAMLNLNNFNRLRTGKHMVTSFQYIGFGAQSNYNSLFLDGIEDNYDQEAQETIAQNAYNRNDKAELVDMQKRMLGALIFYDWMINADRTTSGGAQAQTGELTSQARTDAETNAALGNYLAEEGIIQGWQFWTREQSPLSAQQLIQPHTVRGRVALPGLADGVTSEQLGQAIVTYMRGEFGEMIDALQEDDTGIATQRMGNYGSSANAYFYEQNLDALNLVRHFLALAYDSTLISESWGAHSLHADVSQIGADEGGLRRFLNRFGIWQSTGTSFGVGAYNQGNVVGHSPYSAFHGSTWEVYTISDQAYYANESWGSGHGDQSERPRFTATMSDYATALDDVENYFTELGNLYDTINESLSSNQNVAQATGQNEAWTNPQEQGRIAYWTDEQMRAMASAEGTSIETVVDAAKRSMADALRMWLGCEIYIKAVYPVLGPSRNGVSSISTTHPGGNYWYPGGSSQTEGPASLLQQGSTTERMSTITVPENLILNEWTTERSVYREGGGTSVFAAPAGQGNTSTQSGTPSNPSTNQALQRLDADATSRFTYGCSRHGISTRGLTVYANTVPASFTATQLQQVQQLQASIESWLDRLRCIVNAYNDFNDAHAEALEDLENLSDETRPGSHWYDYLIPDSIFGRFNNTIGQYGDADAYAVINAEMNELGSMTLGGFLESNVERMIFKEQCFLLSYIVPITTYKKDHLNGGRSSSSNRIKRLPYVTQGSNAPQQASILVDGDGYGFINRLTQARTSAVYNHIMPSQISSLQPMIRLFKVFSDSSTGEQRQVEIKFESNHKTLENELHTALRTSADRGTGVGIKNFSFTYDGSNPFAVKKSIKGTLEIFANSFEDLLDERTSLSTHPNTKIYRYIDLALKTSGGNDAPTIDACGGTAAVFRTQEQNANLEKLNFRLKACVGWARPENLDMGRMTERSRNAMLDVIYDSYVTLDLTPTVHDFTFDEQGRVIFRINYLAYIEDFYDQNAFNIFADAQTFGGGTRRYLTELAIKRELEMDFYTKKCSPGELNNIRRSYVEEVDQEKRAGIANLLAELMSKNKLFYINLPYEDIKAFIRLGPFHTANQTYDQGRGDNDPAFVMNLTQARRAQVATVRETLQANSTAFSGINSANNGMSEAESRNAWKASLFAGTDPNNQVLSFFYASDLVDIILENIEAEIERLPARVSAIQPPESSTTTIRDAFVCKRETKKHNLLQMKKSLRKLRVVLGPLEVVNQADLGQVYQTNLGDVPISTKYFIEWLTDKMLSKQDTVYPLTRFLNDFFNEIVRSFLNNDTCFRWNVSQNVRVQQATITAYGGDHDANRDPLTARARSNGRVRVPSRLTGRPMLSLSPGGDATNPVPLSQGAVGEQWQYMVYFCGRINPSNLMLGNEVEDAKAGIFHYVLGNEKGIVKNIEFQKTQTPGLAEVRFEQDSYDGLRQLRVVYDAFITTYPNVKAFPGAYIFIDPKGFSPGMAARLAASGDMANSAFDLTQYGVGGYYMITKSEHSFAAGVAETKITAKWVHSLESSAASDANPSTGLNPTSTSANAVRKCSTTRAQAPEETETEEEN